MGVLVTFSRSTSNLLKDNYAQRGVLLVVSLHGTKYWSLLCCGLSSQWLKPFPSFVPCSSPLPGHRHTDEVLEMSKICIVPVAAELQMLLLPSKGSFVGWVWFWNYFRVVFFAETPKRRVLCPGQSGLWRSLD